MNKLIVSLAVMLISITTAIAQDAEGCKDHPLLSRMPDYIILECTENFNQLDFFNTKGEDVKLEGNLTFIWYAFNSESQKKEPSFFKLSRIILMLL